MAWEARAYREGRVPWQISFDPGGRDAALLQQSADIILAAKMAGADREEDDSRRSLRRARPWRPGCVRLDAGKGQLMRADFTPSVARLFWTLSGPLRCPAPTATKTVPGRFIRSAIQLAQRAFRSMNITL